MSQSASEAAAKGQAGQILERPGGRATGLGRDRKRAAAGAGLVLLTLASASFLMTLDSSVMNVSIASVAKDMHTTVTGIQTAITMYALVMAALMLTGGKLGTLIGRKRAFAVGCLTYGAGAVVTAVSPSLPFLFIGWSLLEGIGAALILPAVTGLVAANFPPERRSAAYGMVGAACALAIAVGPLLGGAVTTFFSWRWVFAGEFLVVAIIMVLLTKVKDAPADHKTRLDLFGALISTAGVGGFVFGVLRSSEWGWVTPHEGGPVLLGISPVIWLLLAGILLLWVFFLWERRLEKRGKEPLIEPSMLGNRQLTGGLTMFTLQYVVQAGVSFSIPLFLSVVLELPAISTGIRLVPLSLSLLVAAVLIPRIWPKGSPRLIVTLGLVGLLAGDVLLLAGINPHAGAGVVAIPLTFMGLGFGALASQLAAVTVSAVPDHQSAEVGGLQNTVTNLGSSLGTALVGAIVIASLTGAWMHAMESDTTLPEQAKARAEVTLAKGVPFMSNADLENTLKKAQAPQNVADQILATNTSARLSALRNGLSIVALVIVVALFFARRLPRRPPGTVPQEPAQENQSL